MPSPSNRLRSDVVVVSIACVSGLILSSVTAVSKKLRITDKTMTIPIRARKITTGWGTMFPTFSIPSRNRCITVFGTVFGAVALIASVMIWPSSEMIAPRGVTLVIAAPPERLLVLATRKLTSLPGLKSALNFKTGYATPSGNEALSWAWRPDRQTVLLA
jgi:hypothetical protein